jgi:hypothetical protein
MLRPGYGAVYRLQKRELGASIILARMTLKEWDAIDGCPEHARKSNDKRTEIELRPKRSGPMGLLKASPEGEGIHPSQSETLKQVTDVVAEGYRSYTLNGNPVGDLTYAYDQAGQRTSVGGSLSRTGLPQALGSATVDAGNQLVTSGGSTLIYDPTRMGT